MPVLPRPPRLRPLDRRGIVVALLLMTIAYTPAAAGAAAAAPSPSARSQVSTLFGVAAFPQYRTPARNRQDFAMLAAAGLRLVRFDARWDELQPTGPGGLDAPYLAKLDDILDAASEAGVTVVLCVHKTPAWARDYRGTPESGLPPSNPATYAAFIGLLAAHERDRAGMIYEIWNEPNYQGFWNTRQGPSGTAYTRMLRRAYVAVKAADPDATVIAGALNHFDAGFLKWMYRAGAHGYFDAFSIHPYSGGSAIKFAHPFTDQVTALRRALLAHGDNVPVWITEYGVPTSGPLAVSEAKRGRQLRDAVNAVARWPWVAGLAVFTLNTQNGAEWGLIDSKTLVPKPSWKAYVAAVRRVRPAPAPPSTSCGGFGPMPRSRGVLIERRPAFRASPGRRSSRRPATGGRPDRPIAYWLSICARWRRPL